MKDSRARDEGEDGGRGSLGPRHCSVSRHNECWHLSQCTYTVNHCVNTSWVSVCLEVWDRTLETGEEVEEVGGMACAGEERGRERGRSSGILTGAWFHAEVEDLASLDPGAPRGNRK